MNAIKSILVFNLKLILASAMAFLLGIPSGIIAYPLVADKLAAILMEVFGDVMSGTTVDIILKVFFRNTTASLMILFLGLTVILALLSLFVNGFLVGLVLRFAQEKGLNATSLLFGLIPHGIFELPALFISAGLGMRVGIQILTSKGGRRKAAAQAIREASVVYLIIILPLLAVAAVVEILVSRNLIQ